MSDDHTPLNLDRAQLAALAQAVEKHFGDKGEGLVYGRFSSDQIDVMAGLASEIDKRNAYKADDRADEVLARLDVLLEEVTRLASYQAVIVGDRPTAGHWRMIAQRAGAPLDHACQLLSQTPVQGVEALTGRVEELLESIRSCPPRSWRFVCRLAEALLIALALEQRAARARKDLTP